MNRLQAFLLVLEVSVFIWIGVFIAGRWIVEQSDIDIDFDTASSIK